MVLHDVSQGYNLGPLLSLLFMLGNPIWRNVKILDSFWSVHLPQPKRTRSATQYTCNCTLSCIFCVAGRPMKALNIAIDLLLWQNERHTSPDRAGLPPRTPRYDTHMRQGRRTEGNSRRTPVRINAHLIGFVYACVAFEYNFEWVGGLNRAAFAEIVIF